MAPISSSPCPRSRNLLEIFDPVERLTRIAELLDIEIEKLSLDRTIQGRVKKQMEKVQKEYYLNEKIKAIQKELGRGEKSEFEQYRKRIKQAGMTKDASTKALAEVQKLENMPPMSAEATVSHNLRRLAALGAVEGQEPRKFAISPTRTKCLRPTTTAWKKSRSGSWNSWPCGDW